MIGTLAVSKTSTLSPLLDKGKAMASHGLDPCLNGKETPVAATGLRVVMTSKKSRTVMLASSSAWKSRISEKEHKAFARWHGDDAARRAVYNNRARLKSTVAPQGQRMKPSKS